MLCLLHTLPRDLNVLGPGTSLHRLQLGLLGTDVGLGCLDSRLESLHVGLGCSKRLLLCPDLVLGKATVGVRLIALGLGDETSRCELCTTLILLDGESLLCLKLV